MDKQVETAQKIIEVRTKTRELHAAPQAQRLSLRA